MACALAPTFSPERRRGYFSFLLVSTCWVRVGRSLILSVGMVNSRLRFLGSFAAIAPSQQFSVLCIFPHVSHLGFGGSF